MNQKDGIEQKMIRILVVCAALCDVLFLSGAARAETPERLEPERSEIHQTRQNVSLTLALSDGVPYRVFTLDAPARLVIDFRGVSGQGDIAPLRDALPPAVSGLRFGTFQPGWARLIADLTAPMLPDDVNMTVDQDAQGAELTLTLLPVPKERFAAASGAPDTAPWPRQVAIPEQPSDAPFVVVIDPGHGGIDPGAERDGVSEKTLMLDMALALHDRLEETEDIEAILTRDSDVFVSLQTRVAYAQQLEADMFLSLHADALSEGGAHGATIYTLSDEASDIASAQLAARHNRADIIAGLDLTHSDDQVTRALLDLARQQTKPRTSALARIFVEHMAEAGGPMNRRPLREAGFSVLKSADIPSVLIEVGFLSSPRDLENLRDAAWRDGMVEAMADAILDWRNEDQAYRALLLR